VDRHSIAARAGLQPRQWIVGVEHPTSASGPAGEAYLTRSVAFVPADQTVTLRVYDQLTRKLGTIPVRLAAVPAFYRTLRDLFQRIPEPSDQAGRFPLFLGLLVAVLVITISRAGFVFIQEYLIGTAIWQGIMDLRCDNYDAVLRLPTTFFSEKGVSDATSRFIQDTSVLARGQNTLLGKTLVEPAKAIATLALALVISWQLTLIALIAGPPAFLLIRKFGKKMHKASRRSLESWSVMLAVLGETLQGIRVVKAYTMEAAERLRFFRVNRALLKQQRRMERLDAAGGPTVEALGLVTGMLAQPGTWYFSVRAPATCSTGWTATSSSRGWRPCSPCSIRSASWRRCRCGSRRPRRPRSASSTYTTRHPNRTQAVRRR
jgi:ABC-type multidrug transport system fused ATPase/permease subunit